MASRCLAKALQLVAANLLLFGAYRLLFVHLLAPPEGWDAAPAILGRGLRLDLALLWIEGALIAALAILTGRLRYRAVIAALWVCTALNLATAVTNLLFYRERNQHVWEMLLANLGRPSEILVAVEPFLAMHPLAPLGLVVGAGALVLVAVRHARPLAGHSVDLWRRPVVLAALLGAVGLAYLAALEPIPRKGKEPRRALPVSAHHMVFAHHALNQAVVNPLYDLLRHYLPSRLTVAPYRLPADEAFAESRDLLALAPGDRRYPLLRTVTGEVPLGIENVVLIQVEGLGGSILERRQGDGWLMRFVRDLGARGLYFPNVVQSFCATDGSIFAATTSLLRPLQLGSNHSYFLPWEVTARYGSLAQSLGRDPYRHYFFAGFRQRNRDFVAFMSNQGYTAFGYDELRARLGNAAATESDALGVFDGPMLREAAEVLLATPGPFTAHIVTATSHSPWVLPPGTPVPETNPRLAVFAYVDGALREFVETLAARHPAYDRTLFVVIGDHTSLTFGGGWMERLRVPLVLFNSRLARERARWAGRQDTVGSHLDLLPTILGLLDGTHPFAGMGRDLLAAAPGASGVVSGSHDETLYLKDGFALAYTPHDGRATLHPVEGGEILLRDVSAEEPAVADRLTREYLALAETSERLIREGRIAPLAEDDVGRSVVGLR